MTTRQRIYIGSATSTLIVFAIIEWLTGVFIAAPQQDFGDLAGIHPAIRLQINTAPIEREILNELENSGAFAPEFLVRAALPHGLSLWMAPDYERLMVEVRVLLQERRAGPLIARAINRDAAYAEIEQFAFAVEGAQAPARGAVTLNGWFPMEESAAIQLFDKFHANPAPPLPEFEGDHLLELRADNRNGAAYIVFASLLNAFEIDLTEREEKISLASFRFVEEIVLTGDLVLGDSIGIVCAMEIEAGQKNKIGVVNLRAGIGELFERIGHDLQRDYGLTLTGQSEWHGDTLVFTYRLDDVPTLLSALRKD